jgi:uncharacterized integral membrane protein (TIGR00697 family)
MKKENKKISQLQFILTLVFIVCLLIANIITGKQMQLPFGIVMTSAVIVFPITYILSDVFSEIYGYKWSRFTNYLGFIANVFMVVIFQIAISSPAPSYFENQTAFEIVLGNTPRVLIASLVASLVGDFVNDRIFKKMKEKHLNSSKGFGSRAILSSVGGNFTDSFIFLPLAFIGQMPLQTLFIMLITQASLKTLYEIVMLPVTHLVVRYVAKKEMEIN